LYAVAWFYTSRNQSRERSAQLRNRKATTLLRLLRKTIELKTKKMYMSTSVEILEALSGVDGKGPA
jgi:hypothetical protein